MEAIVELDGRTVGFKASALTPRLYRIQMRRDIVQDLNRLQRAFEKAVAARNLVKPAGDASEEEKQAYADAVKDAELSVVDLTIFENTAYVMAKQYAPGQVPGTVDEWLDSFDTFSVYQILPTILQLWGLNRQTTAVPKKK